MSAGVTRSGDDKAQRAAAAPAGRHKQHLCFVEKHHFVFVWQHGPPSDTPTVGAAHPAGRLQAGHFGCDRCFLFADICNIYCLLVGSIATRCPVAELLKKTQPTLKQQHHLLLRISLFHIKCTKQTQYLLSAAFNLCQSIRLQCYYLPSTASHLFND